MAIEGRRGCGYRKVGGLYLISTGLMEACHRLPLETSICPTCGTGIRPSRAWTWIDPQPILLPDSCANRLPNVEEILGLDAAAHHCMRCVVCDPTLLSEGEHGLIWVGVQHYPKPDLFLIESVKMGVSRRIQAVPKGFVLGETWVFLGHPKAIRRPTTIEVGKYDFLPGIFQAFKPQRIELVCKQSQMEDEEWVEKQRKRGLSLFPVPDDDPDHNPDAADQNNQIPL